MLLGLLSMGTNITDTELSDARGPVNGVLLQPGDVVDGRYRVEQEIGRGGMGVVYRATDETLDRPTALKVLDLGSFPGVDPVAILQREAKLLASIKSAHVVQVYAFGRHGELCFFAMEYVAGRPLAEIVDEHNRRRERIPLHRALTILGLIAAGLAAVHATGLVHRDVKPDNIIIEEDTGRPVLLDFGLAGGALSDTEAIQGTPAYMAPEQTSLGAATTTRTDVYALGCVAFELLTGAPPFNEREPFRVLVKHATTPAPAVSGKYPELAPFDAVLGRALAKDPSDRFESCPALASALALAADPRRRPALRSVAPEPRARGAVRVLIVDDDPAFQRFTSRAVGLVFLDRAAAVDVAGSGPEALELAESAVPDLVLLDYDMPELDGIDTLSRLRAFPGGDRVRVIVMSTPLGLTVSRWRFSILGVKDFVAKPVSLGDLVTAIGAIADRAGWREEER
jgi:serine/threonine-protein kinase